MPAVSIERQVAASPEQAWAFIADMDNWAPLLTGYERHERFDDSRSRWTVRGELAGLTRVADIDVLITRWEAPTAIAFTLEGVDEPFTGSGEFSVLAAPPAVADAAAPAARPGRWARLRTALVRWLLSRLTKGAGAGEPPARDHAVAGQGGTLLRCNLEVTAGGGSGPIMNLLLGPILDTVAEDTAGRIIAAIEG